jgi:hypothetical protein
VRRDRLQGKTKESGEKEEGQQCPNSQKHPLQSLVDQEERALSQIAKASSERVDTVRRAKAVLAVKARESFTVAVGLSGFQSADSVSQLVQLFNQ